MKTVVVTLNKLVDVLSGQCHVGGIGTPLLIANSLTASKIGRMTVRRTVSTSAVSALGRGWVAVSGGAPRRGSDRGDGRHGPGAVGGGRAGL